MKQSLQQQRTIDPGTFWQSETALTFHAARHTFATTVTLSNGMPIETVSGMLGHKNFRTTKIYAKVVQKKISRDMKVLKGEADLTQPYYLSSQMHLYSPNLITLLNANRDQGVKI